ncbi:hypothetical protein BDV38DRAFT_55899 [Aspergillus pseudotamarii]|uniref:Uncharacterized protein n=1 Tax=Aspergillus pseudotamarii TaxID=132259 RepID=A0A5N6SXD6_ASPPS|nr:uncharacterized protein BDV38DRAFT_55899 [Aspergillus pseudotamarii]KAE8139272.1 hypothetical protein BDV38DRAFT_55899 [Aspergillus pseudotamarii]
MTQSDLSGRAAFYLKTIQLGYSNWKFETDDRGNKTCVENPKILDAYIMPLLGELRLAVSCIACLSFQAADQGQHLPYTVLWFKVPTPLAKKDGGYLIPLHIISAEPRRFPGSELHPGKPESLSESLDISPEFVAIIALPKSNDVIIHTN